MKYAEVAKLTHEPGCAWSKGDDFCDCGAIEDSLVARVAELETTVESMTNDNCHQAARIEALEKALAEAMEWNWLDDNADETIPAWIAQTLYPKP